MNLYKILSDKFILVAIFIVFFLRLPGLFQELPPYQFCDEEFFWGEVTRMIGNNSNFTQEFRAGGANIYPMFYFTKALNLFLSSNIDPTKLLVLGRLIMVGILGSINIIIIKKICDILFSNDKITKISIILYILSPYILSNSRIWYPDNYVYVFSALYFLALIKIYKYPLNYKGYILLSLGLSLTISTKYTGIILLLPTFIIIIFNLIENYNNKKFLRNCFIMIIFSILFFSLLNYSIFYKFDKFIGDFNSNRDLYKNNGVFILSNYLYYFNFTFTMVYGLLTFPLWIYGAVCLIRIKNCKFKCVYLLIPILFIIFLGSLGKVLNRNVSILIPFVLPIVAFGIYHFVYNCRFFTKKIRFLVIVLGLVIPQGIQSLYIFYHNFYPDSRRVAQIWLKNNINRSADVGFNDACSGSSAAAIAGLNAIYDPYLKHNFEYYVLNSYWASIIDKYYFNRYGYLRFIDQKYIHFYEYENNDAIKSVFLENLDSFKVNNYSIIKIFNSNGPDIIVLKKDD